MIFIFKYFQIKLLKISQIARGNQLLYLILLFYCFLGLLSKSVQCIF